MKAFYKSILEYKILPSTLLACSFLAIVNIPASSAADIQAPPTLTADEQSDDNQKQRDSSVPSPNDNNEVTIIQKKDATIEEVRVNGKLRYAKITPKKGKPYYLYDSNGDGILDATETDIKKANVNQWILMEW